MQITSGSHTIPQHQQPQPPSQSLFPAPCRHPPADAGATARAGIDDSSRHDLVISHCLAGGRVWAVSLLLAWGQLLAGCQVLAGGCCAGNGLPCLCVEGRAAGRSDVWLTESYLLAELQTHCTGRFACREWRVCGAHVCRHAGLLPSAGAWLLVHYTRQAKNSSARHQHPGQQLACTWPASWALTRSACPKP